MKYSDTSMPLVTSWPNVHWLETRAGAVESSGGLSLDASTSLGLSLGDNIDSVSLYFHPSEPSDKQLSGGAAFIQ